MQSSKKGCSTVAMLPEGNRQDHSWQKDFGQSYDIFFFLHFPNDLLANYLGIM